MTAQGVLAAVAEGQPGGLFGPDFLWNWTGGGIVGGCDGAQRAPRLCHQGCQGRNIQLAHVASAQGGERRGGHPGPEARPGPVCGPQLRVHQPRVASVGLTRGGGQAAGVPVKPAEYPAGATGRVPHRGHRGGYVKLVTDQATADPGGPDGLPPGHRPGGGTDPGHSEGITVSRLATVIHPPPPSARCSSARKACGRGDPISHEPDRSPAGECGTWRRITGFAPWSGEDPGPPLGHGAGEDGLGGLCGPAVPTPAWCSAATATATTLRGNFRFSPGLCPPGGLAPAGGLRPPNQAGDPRSARWNGADFALGGRRAEVISWRVCTRALWACC